MTRSTTEALAIDRHRDFQRAAAQSRTSHMSRRPGKPRFHAKALDNVANRSAWLAAIVTPRQPI